MHYGIVAGSAGARDDATGAAVIASVVETGTDRDSDPEQMVGEAPP